MEGGAMPNRGYPLQPPEVVMALSRSASEGARRRLAPSAPELLRTSRSDAAARGHGRAVDAGQRFTDRLLQRLTSPERGLQVPQPLIRVEDAANGQESSESVPAPSDNPLGPAALGEETDILIGLFDAEASFRPVLLAKERQASAASDDCGDVAAVGYAVAAEVQSATLHAEQHSTVAAASATSAMASSSMEGSSSLEIAGPSQTPAPWRCNICLENDAQKHEEEVCVQKECKGKTCTNCLTAYFEQEAAKCRYTIFPVRCPTCRQRIPCRRWQKLVSAQVVDEYAKGARDLLSIRCPSCDETRSMHEEAIDELSDRDQAMQAFLEKVRRRESGEDTERGKGKGKASDWLLFKGKGKGKWKGKGGDDSDEDAFLGYMVGKGMGKGKGPNSDDEHPLGYGGFKGKAKGKGAEDLLWAVDPFGYLYPFGKGKGKGRDSVDWDEDAGKGKGKGTDDSDEDAFGPKGKGKGKGKRGPFDPFGGLDLLGIVPPFLLKGKGKGKGNDDDEDDGYATPYGLELLKGKGKGEEDLNWEVNLFPYGAKGKGKGKGGDNFDWDEDTGKGKGKGGDSLVWDEDAGKGKGKGTDDSDEDSSGSKGGGKGKGNNFDDVNLFTLKGKGQGKGGANADDEDAYGLKGRGKGKGGDDFDAEDAYGLTGKGKGKGGENFDQDEDAGKGKGKGGDIFAWDEDVGKGKGKGTADSDDDALGPKGEGKGKGSDDANLFALKGKGLGKGGANSDEDDTHGFKGKGKGKGGDDFDTEDAYGWKGKGKGRGEDELDEVDGHGWKGSGKGKGEHELGEDAIGPRGKGQGKGSEDHYGEEDASGSKGEGKGKGKDDSDEDSVDGKGKGNKKKQEEENRELTEGPKEKEMRRAWAAFQTEAISVETVLESILAAVDEDIMTFVADYHGGSLPEVLRLITDLERRTVLHLCALRRHPFIYTHCCSEPMCFKCKISGHHGGKECAEVQREALEVECQFCPECGVATQKTEGCDAMMCLCGANWTWVGEDMGMLHDDINGGVFEVEDSD